MGQIKVEKNASGIEGLCVIEPTVHGVMQGIHFVHGKTPITKDFFIRFFFSNFQGTDMRSISAIILTQLTQEVYL